MDNATLLKTAPIVSFNQMDVADDPDFFRKAFRVSDEEMAEMVRYERGGLDSCPQCGSVPECECEW